jgi:hypothetical protein
VGLRVANGPCTPARIREVRAWAERGKKTAKINQPHTKIQPKTEHKPGGPGHMHAKKPPLILAFKVEL